MRWVGTLASPSSQSPVAWCLPPWATQASPPHNHATPAPTNVTICPKKPTRVRWMRRGEGTLASPWLEGEDSWDQDEGDASVPSPHPHRSRPYGTLPSFLVSRGLFSSLDAYWCWIPCTPARATPLYPGFKN